MNLIHFHAPWHRLRKAIVGCTYGVDFYEPIADHRIRENLQRIALETQQDLDDLATVLRELNVQVYRPVLDKKTIMDYLDHDGRISAANSGSLTLIPRPPMQPRDSILVVEHTVYATNAESIFYREVFDDIGVVPVSIPSDCDFDAPMVTVIGDRIIVDACEDPKLPHKVRQILPDHKTIVPTFIGGHNDAVFCPLKPGVLISSHHHCDYQETFPDWEIFRIQNQSWQAIPEWRQIKNRNALKWWVPDSENNHDFSVFVDTWLTNWVGHVGETVFDVNMLPIDQHTVLVNNYNHDAFEFFKKHGITPIITPIRHRFFWDGGVHCVTSDLCRHD